jgi:hypothetical protein
VKIKYNNYNMHGDKIKISKYLNFELNKYHFAEEGTGGCKK